MSSILEYPMVSMKLVKFPASACETKSTSNNCWSTDNVVRNVCRWSCFKTSRMLRSTSPPIQTPTRSERTRTFMIGKVGSVKGQGYTTFLSDMLSILNILVIFVILKKVRWSRPFLGYILLKKSFVYTNNHTLIFKI